MTTKVWGASGRSCFKTSSPLMPGIFRSSMTRSGVSCSSAFSRGLECVLKEVEQHLFELVPIRINLRQCRWKRTGQCKTLLRERQIQQFQHFLDQVVQIEQDRRQLARASVVNDLIRNAIQTPRFPQDDFELRTPGVGLIRLIEQK